jgi:membrane-bound metal-dependent hydrolase YbcI (DUF457 family)
MLRSIAAVVAGCVVWMVTAFGTDLIVFRLFPQYVINQTRVENTPLLFFILSYCVAYSVLGGYVAAWVARRREVLHATVLGLLQLTLGTIATVLNWETAPAWFHIAVLVTVLPANVAGGRWRAVRKEVALEARPAAAV